MSDTTTSMTAEQLWERAGQGRSELIRGQLIELMPFGQLHGKLVARIIFLLLDFLEKHRLGSVSTQVGVVLARHPDLVYAPDVLFIAKERDREPHSARFFEGAPDLAVEVLSPEDQPAKIQERVRDYLAFRTRLVWIVDPVGRTVTAYQPSGAERVCSGGDEVTGQDVLPGFSFTPEKLFSVS